MIKIKSDKIITPRGIIDGYLYIDGEKIKEVSTNSYDVDKSYDFSGKYVSAGFIDLHTHGGGGHAFINSTPHDVVEGCNFHVAYGTTSIVPTISAGEFSVMRKAVEDIRQAKKFANLKANVIGAHLEGPYLSLNQAGAQCPTFITAPKKDDYQKLIKDFGDTVTRFTYAPENDENGEFCRYLTSNGIIASVGHSDAKYQHVDVAIKNGANLITHLYSCTSTVTREYGFRSLGVIETAFLRDELYVEIIADGKHLPYELIQMIIKIKGADKVALITDSLEIAGTSQTEGVMSGVQYVVEDGVCKLKDRSAFAGSVATADTLIKTLVFGCGYSVPFAVKMLTEVPAKILKVNKGKLYDNYDADVTVFDENVTVTDVFVMGKKVI